MICMSHDFNLEDDYNLEDEFNPQLEFKRFVAKYKTNDIYHLLKAKVIGQDDELMKASALIYAYMKSISLCEDAKKFHFMIEGSSGCGKTTFAKALKEILPIPVITVDSSQITQAGFRGVDFADIMNNKELARYWHSGIVICDEIDKMMYTYHEGNNLGKAVQENFLKALDGDTVIDRDGKEFFCGRILFIGMGAFSDLRKKPEQKRDIGFNSSYNYTVDEAEEVSITRDMITKYGESEQFMGRFVTVLHFKRLNMEAYRKIAWNAFDEVRSIYGRKACITISEKQMDKIIYDSIDSQYGCRNIRNAVLEYVLENYIYEIMSA